MTDIKKINKFIELPEGKINTEYIDVNSQSNLILLFLHEGLGSIKQWKDFPELLCRMTGFNGFIYERFGYGKSDSISEERAINYMKDEAFNYLQAILTNSGINKKEIILIGHSDGGTIGLLYASKNPSNLKCLISIAAHTFIENISIQGVKKAVESFTEGDLREKLMKYHGDKTDKMFTSWSNLWLDKNSHKWNMFDELEKITCPVLLIQGDNDEYGSEEQINSIINRVKGIAKKEIIYNCGHQPHIQARDYTAAIIVKFLYETGIEFDFQS